MKRRYMPVALFSVAALAIAGLGFNAFQRSHPDITASADAAEVAPEGSPPVPAEAVPGNTLQAPVSIMPLGDSITSSPGCWRGNLWDRLVEAGHDIHFVGSESDPCPPSAVEEWHEGHGGYKVTDSVANGYVRSWLELNTPDVLMMHFGTNDMWREVPVEAVMDAYTQVVADLRELNPSAVILIAQIIPLHPEGCDGCPERAIALNALIPGWAERLTTEDSPIWVVDQHTGFVPATDTSDGVHPDGDGYVKIAANWFAALDPILP
ncbi:SGNH/GDSL hydrolase family protein [Glycomyces buryatensis]|uniref:SGNH hydrolase-type esterase domain-containing protein n=1 Tax=Glycomyces buryatensis TaxID=2570927 RepID=A0A4S8QAT7_9ACTN|nr:SGNH/GDSL hydrolase family protein [Glycomyces buryatensis]THV41448.1 hypothetical protein FAB82_11660 [Glycomyces buryatensis]